MADTYIVTTKHLKTGNQNKQVLTLVQLLEKHHNIKSIVDNQYFQELTIKWRDFETSVKKISIPSGIASKMPDADSLDIEPRF